MDDDISDPINPISIPVLLRFAHAAYSRAIRAAQAEIDCDDIPANGAYVIGAIARGHSPLAEIIEQLGMSKQAAGQLVDTLVLRGYLHRAIDPEDRRRLTLSLTERGRAAARAAREAIERIEMALIERFGLEHIARTRETLAALCDWDIKLGQQTMAQRKSFEHNNLDNAVFTDCAMTGSRFDDVNLANASFSNVNLKDAIFTDVNLAGVVIEDANIEGLRIFGHDIQALIRAHAAGSGRSLSIE